MSKWLAVDMSSILWSCLMVGKDVDGSEVTHNGKPMWVNTAQYGYENATNSINAALSELHLPPRKLLMVFEGEHSKHRRLMIDPTYKVGADNRSPEAYIQFNELKRMVRSAYSDVGAIALVQDLAEGDDTLAYLAENTEEDLVIMTNDNDLVVLNKINAYGATVMVRVNGNYGQNKYGDFPLHAVTVYKALVGDSSDKIKGVPGFGAVAFLEVVSRYGDSGLDLLATILAGGERDRLAKIAHAKQCKALQKIVDNFEAAVKCYKLVLLRPEWVNTLKHQLQWFPGLVKAEVAEEVKPWRLKERLITADNYAEALDFLNKKMAETDAPAFDIETSTPPESDDWLDAASGKAGEVDTLGSFLVGFSITFGRNNQYTYYVSVKHKDTNNITMQQARLMIESMFGKDILIHNTMFELSVLYNAQDEDGGLWRDAWTQYGERGFIPKIRDTKIESSYVNENIKNGLKLRTSHHLGYEQQSFDSVVTIDGVKHKMDQLTAEHVFSYGADDATCTAALGNFYKFHMQLEHHYNVYKEVEIDAAYLHAQNFIRGVNYSIARMKEIEAEDKIDHDKAWAVVVEYLTAKEWPGTVLPQYGADISVAQMKEAYGIITGVNDDDDEDTEEGEDDGTEGTVSAGSQEKTPKAKDPILSSRTRTPSKFPSIVAETQPELAEAIQKCMQGDSDLLNGLVKMHFKGTPLYKISNKNNCKLLYETMGLPIRVRNKPTAKMKAEGKREGNPKGDALAVAYALRDADADQKKVLEALKMVQVCRTKQTLYYNNYPYFVHWKTGRIHSGHNQAAQNTRRATSSAPNETQQPKHPKIEGMKVPFRQTVVPHKKNAVVVSMDFKAQELRVIADYSQDPALLACYIGDYPKDMHIMTGVGILQDKYPKDEWTYEKMEAILGDPKHELYGLCKEHRALGKKVNFTTEYGAAAPKLAATLLIDEDTAQRYIDVREETFARAAEWKKEVIAEAKKYGYVTTKLGARRHLAPMLNSDDRFTASKADRQAVNFKIQSSSAEMTKLSEGRMWRAGIFDIFDAMCYGPRHDEVVASIVVDDKFYDFIAQMHACMAQKYADMTVPIESDISFGKTWGHQIECGPVPSREALDAGLVEYRKQLEVA